MCLLRRLVKIFVKNTIWSAYSTTMANFGWVHIALLLVGFCHDIIITFTPSAPPIWKSLFLYDWRRTKLNYRLLIPLAVTSEVRDFKFTGVFQGVKTDSSNDNICLVSPCANYSWIKREESSCSSRPSIQLSAVAIGHRHQDATARIMKTTNGVYKYSLLHIATRVLNGA